MNTLLAVVFCCAVFFAVLRLFLLPQGAPYYLLLICAGPASAIAGLAAILFAAFTSSVRDTSDASIVVRIGTWMIVAFPLLTFSGVGLAVASRIFFR